MKRAKYRVRPEIIQDFLQRYYMSAREFARNEEISSAYLTQLMNGDRLASPRMQRMLIEATGIPHSLLFEEVKV